MGARLAAAARHAGFVRQQNAVVDPGTPSLGRNRASPTTASRRAAKPRHPQYLALRQRRARSRATRVPEKGAGWGVGQGRARGARLHVLIALVRRIDFSGIPGPIRTDFFLVDSARSRRSIASVAERGALLGNALSNTRACGRRVKHQFICCLMACTPA